MPDHDVIFSQLATELKNQVTPFVAVLTSKDCAGVYFSSFNFLFSYADRCEDDFTDNLTFIDRYEFPKIYKIC